MSEASSPAAASSTANLRFIVLVSCTAALGGFLFGYDTAVINGAVNALQEHFQIDKWTVGLAVSLALLGSAVGAFAAGPFTARYGRVPAMIASSVLFVISAIGSGMPFTIHDFIVWRVIGGIAVGMASVIAPAYIAEMAPAHLRGRLGSLQQLAIVIGIFLALLSNYALVSHFGGAEAPGWFGFKVWRWMFWSELPPAILFGVAALMIPESPRFLVAAGRHEHAKEILARIFGSIVAAEKKLVEIMASLGQEYRPRFRDLRGPALGLLAVVWVGIFLSAFQQLCGINAMFYYSTTLWQSAGFSESHSVKISMITGLVNVGTTLLAIATVDRFGRKPLLLVGSAGMALSLLTMAACFHLAGHSAGGSSHLSGSLAWTALVSANAFVFFFGFSWGPVVWVLLGEMFPNRIRTSALALAAAVQWVANFGVSTTFPPMLSSWGLAAPCLFYGLCAAASFFFVLRFVRETKGRELEQMES